jgi:hypothetical protein
MLNHHVIAIQNAKLQNMGEYRVNNGDIYEEIDIAGP